MAILESIRKRSLFLILVIGLALFAFIISGIFTQGGGLSTTKSVIGKVNDVSIAREDFAQKVESASRNFGAGASTVQVVNQIWNREVRNTLLEQQFEDLGLSIERDQIINVIKSNPTFTSDPTFQNEFGLFDEGRFIEFIADLKANNPLGYQQWQLQEESLVNSAKEQMYFNLVKAGVGSTIKEGELNYKLENDKVDIKFARVPFSTIPDSTITVTKSDIQKYINEHKDLYEEEASRDIQYVFFEETPSLDDDTKVRTDLAGLLDRDDSNDSIGFKNTTEVEAFIDRNSTTKYQDKYIFKDQLNAAVADSIFTLSEGGVFGPYKDASSYKMSRLIGRTRIADSVKSSYILVPYVGSLAANATTTKTEEEAKKTIDSIFKLVRNDKAKFTEIADTINQDATRGKGGDLGWIRYSQITDETFDRDFSDFMFFNDNGSIGVVKTKFGFHVIRIDEQTSFKEGVKLATIERPIEPSEETINNLFTTTTKYEIEANEKDFEEVAKNNNYIVRPVNKVKELDENLPGLGAQRRIVQWAFNEETKVGDIKRFDLSNGYAVARVTGKRAKKGLAAVEDVSSRILPIIRRQRKAEIIRSKSSATSIDDFATQNGVTISTATALTMNSTTIPGAGREPKVVGAAFGLEEGASSGFIDGENGVFIIQVTKKEAAVPLDNYGTYTLNQKTRNRNNAINAAFNALRKAADIEDNRATFY